MADAPNEEQVQAANKAEEQKWADDFPQDQLNVPYKKEEADDTASADKPKNGDDSKAGPEEDAETPEEVEHADPTPVVTVEDPGDYTPADYSFEVVLKDGKTVTIKSPEEAEKLSEDPDNFETPKQLLDFIKKTTQMQNKLDKDYDKWEQQKKTYTEQSEQQAARQKAVDDLSKGFEYLTSKGFLPKVSAEDANADWSDPEVAKRPGVKEQIDLMNYMVKENESRAKAGIPALTSALDAFNAWQLDNNRKKSEEDRKAAGEARKAAGAKVASVSPSQQGSYVPKGIAVGRVMPSRGAAMWDD